MSILADSYKTMILDERQKNTVLRFTGKCGLIINWGILLLHKVGTGKTISSLLIALNNITPTLDPNKITEIIVISPIGIFSGFVKDYKTILNNPDANVIDKTITVTDFQEGKKAVLIDYDYDMLINDINKKKLRYDFKDKIVIFDEAHRLLTKTLFNSIQASNVMDKHSFFEDQYFLNNIYQSKNAIILTGTPMQMSPADLCIFANFITKTDNFSIQKYAVRGLSPSLWIFLARHWKFINGVLIGAANIVYTNQAKQIVQIKLSEMCSGCEILECFIPAIFNFISTYICSGAVSTLKRKTTGGNKKTKMCKKTKKNITKKMYGGVPDHPQNIIGSIVFGAATAVLNSLQGKIKPTELINMYYAEPKEPELREIIYELEEPQYNMKLLALDMSEFISIYDYELQDKTCSGELDTVTPTFFPKKIVLEMKLHYSEDQLELQYLYNLGLLNPIQKRIFNKSKYPKIDLDVNSNKLEFYKLGKIAGNYSPNVLEYYTKMDTTTYTRYQAFTRTPHNYEVTHSAESLSPNSTNIRCPNIFRCPKFEDIVEKLKYLANNDFFINTDNTPINTKQPHSYENENENEKYRYLPLIYSYNEDYGTSLIACYLESLHMPYILIHTLQKGIMEYDKPYIELLSQSIDRDKLDNLDLLEYNKLIAFSLAYKYEEYNIADNKYPFCVILDPTMTEGLNATYNPAIFIMEPCNSFGDHEQVCGRVLRKYNNQSLMKDLNNKVKLNNIEQFQKLIYQYIITSSDDFNKKYPNLIANFKGIFDRANELRKIKGEYLQYSNNPSEYVVSSLKFKFCYPDEKAWQKISREEANLFAFEKSVKYNIYCSDITFTTNCSGETEEPEGNTEETKKFGINNIISGIETNEHSDNLLFNLLKENFDTVKANFEKTVEKVKTVQTEKEKNVPISQLLKEGQPPEIQEFENDKKSKLCDFLKGEDSINYTKLCIGNEEPKITYEEIHKKTEESGKAYCNTLKEEDKEYTELNCERFEFFEANSGGSKKKYSRKYKKII